MGSFVRAFHPIWWMSGVESPLSLSLAHDLKLKASPVCSLVSLTMICWSLSCLIPPNAHQPLPPPPPTSHPLWKRPSPTPSTPTTAFTTTPFSTPPPWPSTTISSQTNPPPAPSSPPICLAKKLPLPSPLRSSLSSFTKVRPIPQFTSLPSFLPLPFPFQISIFEYLGNFISSG